MTVKWLKKSSNKTYDITEYVTAVTWSGSVSQASRSLEISVVYSPLDANIKYLQINLGDRLYLYEDDKLLINAMVYTRERVSEQGTVSYTGYDELNRLLKSNGTYSFKNTTPEKITASICNDLKISTGSIIETKVPIKKLLVDGENYYNIIMKAYTKAYQSNGKKYMPFVYNEKLYVIEKGEIISGFYLQDDVNITTSSYSETIENIINKVKIYNENGKQVGEVKDADSINLYGMFQDVYTKEDGVNATTAAKNMLIGIEKTASIEGIGNVSCISGYGIKIKDSITGLTGKFWIDNDTHTWENGFHTMSLELTFKNLMDTQEDDS
jgi:hypothetical protein